MVTPVYVPAGTSFISSSVCRPLKRAKSTVGVPLISETVVPFNSVATMELIWTANEVTAAIGASVPMTNDGAGYVARRRVSAGNGASAARGEQRGSGEREECDGKFATGMEQF